MTLKKLNGKDLLLLLLYVPGHRGQLSEPVMGRTRLTKMIFVFEKEIYKKFRFDKLIPEDSLPQFIPYLFGPFSVDLYNDLHFLIRMGFIIATKADSSESVDLGSAFEYKKWKDVEGVDDSLWTDDSGLSSLELETYIEQEFKLSERGSAFVKQKLLPSISETQLQTLEKFKRNYTAGSLSSILEYVYKTYDSMTEKSLIREKVLGYGQDEE